MCTFTFPKATNEQSRVNRKIKLTMTFTPGYKVSSRIRKPLLNDPRRKRLQSLYSLVASKIQCPFLCFIINLVETIRKVKLQNMLERTQG